MPIGEAIAAGKALVEVSKLVTNLINSPDTDPSHVRAKLQEMLIHLVNAQTGLSEAQQEIMELRIRLDDRAAVKELESDVDTTDDGDYFVRKTEVVKGKHIAYCPTCWGLTQKLVPLRVMQDDSVYECAIHKVLYYTKRYRESVGTPRYRMQSRDSA
jgi:hypothetical protein